MRKIVPSKTSTHFVYVLKNSLIITKNFVLMLCGMAFAY
jgi:hypothetical protein